MADNKKNTGEAAGWEKLRESLDDLKAIRPAQTGGQSGDNTGSKNSNK